VPPQAERGRWLKLAYRDREFYAMRATPLIHWQRVQIVSENL
jgi:hypothetical protein